MIFLNSYNAVNLNNNYREITMPYTLAVISDIHANLTALDTVLAHIIQEYPEIIEIYCPGDLAGYGPDPSAVIDLLLKERRVTVITRGNHDHAVGGGGRDTAKFNPYAQEAIHWQVEVLSQEEKSFLYQLPNSRTCIHGSFPARIAIVHGSPTYPLDEYILPGTSQQKDLFPFMELFELDILLLGHTHIPFIDIQVSKESGNKMIMMNSGSIGQSRDRDPRASYGVIDVEKMNAEIVRVDYDIDLVERKIVEVGLPEYLGQRLHKGI